jgi:DNA-binding NarL/FixJ family response regulator
LTPDCVVIELEMPGMNGLLATLHLKALSRPPRVIILTNRTEPAYRALAEAVQVDGFVGKDKMLIDLLPLIKDWNGTKVIKE